MRRLSWQSTMEASEESWYPRAEWCGSDADSVLRMLRPPTPPPRRTSPRRCIGCLATATKGAFDLSKTQSTEYRVAPAKAVVWLAGPEQWRWGDLLVCFVVSATTARGE